MTFNECKKYHEMLWGKMVERIEEFANGKRFTTTVDTLKQQCIREMLGENKNKKIPNCFFCEYYEIYGDCPLGRITNCSKPYNNFCDCMCDRKYSEAIEIAKRIRDVFK